MFEVVIRSHCWSWLISKKHNFCSILCFCPLLFVPDSSSSLFIFGDQWKKRVILVLLRLEFCFVNSNLTKVYETKQTRDGALLVRKHPPKIHKIILLMMLSSYTQYCKSPFLIMLMVTCVNLADVAPGEDPQLAELTGLFTLKPESATATKGPHKNLPCRLLGCLWDVCAHLFKIFFELILVSCFFISNIYLKLASLAMIYPFSLISVLFTIHICCASFFFFKLMVSYILQILFINVCVTGLVFNFVLGWTLLLCRSNILLAVSAPCWRESCDVICQKWRCWLLIFQWCKISKNFLRIWISAHVFTL